MTGQFPLTIEIENLIAQTRAERLVRLLSDQEQLFRPDRLQGETRWGAAGFPVHRGILNDRNDLAGAGREFNHAEFDVHLARRYWNIYPEEFLPD